MSSAPRILCICDRQLVVTTANELCLTIWCDVCGKLCDQKELIYHCPVQNITVHKNGYDICNQCALNICDGTISTCPHLTRLQKLLNAANDKNITQILNDFHHLLFNHATNNESEHIYQRFGKCNIKTCTTMKRRRKKTNASNKNIIHDDQEYNINQHTSLICQIIDKIHSHFVHSYDIGYRLISNDRNKLQLLKDEKDNDDDVYFYRNEVMMRELHNILLPKHKVNKIYGNTKSLNKFITQKDESKLNNNNINHKNNKDNDINDEKKCNVNNNIQQQQRHYSNYSCGRMFYYWDYYKNNDGRDKYNAGYRYKEWYITPKYNSLKEEIINNNIATISSSEWINEHAKAEQYFKTDYCKSIKRGNRFPDSIMNDRCSFWEIRYNEPICLQHLMALILYCGYSDLAYKFGKTFRDFKEIINPPLTDTLIQEMKNRNDISSDDINEFIKYLTDNTYDSDALLEDLSEINNSNILSFAAIKINNNSLNDILLNINRKTNDKNQLDPHFEVLRSKKLNNQIIEETKNKHRNFYYFGRNIAEATNLFAAPNEKIKIFYHGISQMMLFNNMEFAMYQPFSTTTSYEIAMSFSNNCGMILKLNEVSSKRCFDCAWLSDFPNEREFLFTMSPYALKIVNITNMMQSPPRDLQLFIKSLLLLDRMSCGQYFDEDLSGEIWTNIENAMTKTTDFNKIYNDDVRNYGGIEITHLLKLLTIKLIKHEMNRYEPNKYDIFMNIDCYIDGLLHNMCVNIEMITIDIKTMNEEISSPYTTGYQGYKFLKYLICKPNMEIVDLQFLITLYPNVKRITVCEIPMISESHLKYVFEFVKNMKSKNLVSIYLEIHAEINDGILINPVSFDFSYKTKFNRIGWCIEYGYISIGRKGEAIHICKNATS